MNVNINDYLSEEDKKAIAIDVFRQQVKNELFNGNDGTVQADNEVQRIIGNITHEVVFTEVQKYIPDVKEQIISKVKRVLAKDLNYEVFRKKDAWGKEDSLAITYIKEEVKANEEVFKTRIKDMIANYDLEPTLNEEVANKFDKLAETMYGLSELFNNK